MGEVDKCASELFCAKFDFEELLFEAFFDVMRIFNSVEPLSEYTSPLKYIIVFKIWFYQPCDVTTQIHVGDQCYLR